MVAGLEVVVPEDDGNPFGWAEPDPRGHSVLRPGEGLNREQRRALDRRKRKGRERVRRTPDGLGDPDRPPIAPDSNPSR